MFFFEFISGWLARSTALLGDSLDMFGDASVYALTLYALHRSARTRAGAALFKGAFMLLFGLVVIGDAVRKSMLGVVPEAGWMGVVGLIALAANTICFLLLFSHRSDDLNMRSTWLCSRNDLIANTSVIVAAVLVAFTGTLWPDVVVGLAIAALFLHSAWHVLTEAWREWRANSPQKHNVQHPAPASAALSSDSCCGAETAGKSDSGCSSSAPMQADSCCEDKPTMRQDSCCGTSSATRTDACCGSDATKAESERKRHTTH